MRQTVKRTLAALLALLTLLTLALPAGAAEVVNPANTGNITEFFIDEGTGREISPTTTAKAAWSKSPDKIAGFIYQGFSQETRHIYSQEDLTYIYGYPDKTVHGERNLTRAETAAIFSRLYAGAFPAPQRQMTGSTFADVNSGDWFYPELKTCYDLGLAQGVGGGKYAPNRAVTRAEFAAFAARFASLENSGKAIFSDVTSDHWAYMLINAAGEAGWVKGYGDGTFRPDEYISRAEAVTLINRMRNRSITAEELDELGVKNPYTDLVKTYWAYGDLLEATVKHAAADWHKLHLPEGINQVTERFVDSSGMEIAKPVTSAGAENHTCKEIQNFSYIGYVTEVTYVYEAGKPAATVTKSVDKPQARVGDILTYTVTAKNSGGATAPLAGAVVTDVLPSYVDFLPGSVQIDGKSTTSCGYNGNIRTIMAEMGDIQPGKSKALTFQALVNSTAYGKTFRNTAVLSAENAGDIPAADSGVMVAPGTAEGYSGAKTVDKPNATVGDELTYSISLRNSALSTADWTNVKVSDTIPEFLSFVSGSVQVNGKASNEYSYDANSRTLTLHADAIKPGEDLVFTFRCTVDEGAQGLYIVNTAIVSSPGREDIQLPDTGVQIDAGKAKPLLSKSANVQAAKPGDTITYSIVAKNGADATADWKSITVTDILPVGLELIPGTVRIDNTTVDYSLNGQVLEIFLGNLMPNESAVLTFDVKILQAAAGKIVRNVAAAKGENGEKTASDTGVAVDYGIARLHGTKAVDKATARVGETLTYTVTVGNAEDASVAKNAVIMDEFPEYVSLDQGSVLVDGYAPRQTYDSASRQLFAELGDIAPGQSKTITFTAKVNSNAYGQRFGNTAVLDADNAEPVRVSTPQEVEVPQGVADGSVGAKTVDKPQATVGDELTYSISLRNSALATADWTNVKVSDTIPEFLSFVPGSVQVNGKASNEYSYDANSRTLTLHADAIKPGEDLVFTFRCTVDEGAQGLYIVNTAIVSSPGREDIQLPDTGVQIDAGEPKPILNKSTSVNAAKPGDIFTYNITVKNGADASADWKSVMVTDMIPAGLEFLSNSVLVDNENSIYSVSGRAIEIPVGDLRPNQEKTVSFDVRVLDTAAGQTVYNTAVAKGANGPDKTATDTGVPVEELPEEPTPGAKVPTGTKTVDKVTVGVQETATFTITATNNSETTWTGVEALDTLDDSLMTLLDERVYIDGVQCPMKSGKWAFDGRTLKLSLGDILPGRSVTARFTVQFKNDAGGKVFTNFADLRSGSHDTVHVKAPEVAIQDSTDPVTDIHNGLFYGYSNGMWGPNDPMYLNQVCLVAYRNMTADELAATSGGLVQKTISDGNNSVTLDPGNALDLAVLWALKNGYLAESEYLSCQERSATNAAGVTLHGVATQKLAYQVLEAACKPEKKNAFKDCITNPSGNVSRIKFAQDICKVLGRDTKPDTGSYSLHVYTDIVGTGYEAIVAEISTTHKYTKDDSGHETWVK